MPTPSDLFLSPDLTEDDARAYLKALGFRNPVLVDEHLQGMAEDMVIRETLGRIAGELLPALLETPDPDAAALGLSDYLAARTGRAMFLEYLADDPRAMHVLTCVFGSSPLLGEVLIRNPEYFHWLVSQVERSAPDRQDLEEEIEAMLAGVRSLAEAVEVIRRWQRREILRIGTRDLLRRETVITVTAQLSELATVIVERVLASVSAEQLAAESREAPPGAFAVVAAGMLGGRELDYASNIELIYLFEAEGGDQAAREFFRTLGRTLSTVLSDEAGGRPLYRVEAGLQPGGATGDGVLALEDLEQLTAHGHVPERLALIKARPIAGDRDLGRRFFERAQQFVYQGPPHRTALEEHARASLGGMHDIELLTQIVQLTRGGAHPPARQPGTLAALDGLVRAGVVTEAVKRELEHAYVFLTSIEHRSQLMGGARDLGLGASEDVRKQLDMCRARVREIYQGLFEHREDAG